MANLYPTSISQIENIADSEKLIFLRLQNLDDSYHVFHSATWSERSDGECDFIIFNEHKGFIALEVRGGKIDFDGKRWLSLDADGNYKYIKDPVKLAQDSMRAIKRVYEERYNTPLSGIYTWGVCFADCSRGSGFRTLDLADANILDFCDSDNIEGWVGNLFRINEDYCGVKVLTEEERGNFISLFSRELQIPFSLKRVVLEQQRKFASADLMQEYLLDLFEDKNRIAIQGAAGTGKTWIAMKKAIRLATAGKKVLFLCYSRYVNELISSKLESYRNIDVMTFHSFANSVIIEYIVSEIEKFGCENNFFNCINDLLDEVKNSNSLVAMRECSSGINLDLRVHEAISSLAMLKSGDNYDSILTRYEDGLPIDIIDILSLLIPDDMCKDSFYDERMPLVLSQTFENESGSLEQFTYDAVMIDEGQDFHMSWCDSLKNVFEKYKNRTVYFFYDENQSIFRRQKELPIRELISRSDHNNYIFKLRDNIRNTADIHRYAVEKTGLAPLSRTFDISGVKPLEFEFSNGSEASVFTGSIIDELIVKYKVARDGIVVLSNRSIDYSIFAVNRMAGYYKLASYGTAEGENCINFSTIHEFKGLERDVVILILHKRESEFANKKKYLSEELLYVGFTRARHLLYVLTIQDQ